MNKIALLENLVSFFDEAEEFLEGRRVDPPDATLLLIELPSASFLSAIHGKDNLGEFIAVKIQHRDARQARLYEVCDFAILRLFEISTARIRLHGNRARADSNRHLYPTLTAPTKARGMCRLHRVFSDTLAGAKTAQLPNDHHDCRRSAISITEWHKGSMPLKGRPFAIAMAVNLLPPNLLSARQYKKLLVRGFDLADRMIAKRNV